MSSKVREYAEYFVDGMDEMKGALDKLDETLPLSAKTGGKIGVLLGMNPVTGPVLGGAALGALGVYGASRIVKKVLEKTK